MLAPQEGVGVLHDKATLTHVCFSPALYVMSSVY